LRLQLIVGIPAWQTQNTSPRKDGFADESFLMKYRLASAGERNGNYVVTTFMGLPVPNGGANYSLRHYAFIPTVAGGNRWRSQIFLKALKILQK